MHREQIATIETRLLDGVLAEAVAIAAGYFKAGDLVVFPTDTVYGLGADAFNGPAVERLYAVKQRSLTKGIPILLADEAVLARVCRVLPPSAAVLIQRFWPGPLTLIVPRHPSLPESVSPNDAVAVRIPDNAIARDLIRQAGGAVATTSANLSGQPPATSAAEAFAAFHGLVAAVVDGGPSPYDQASTIVDCTGPALRLVRQGPVSADALGLTDRPGEIS